MNNSKLANAVSQSEKFPRKFKIKHSKLTLWFAVSRLDINSFELLGKLR